MRAFGGRRQRHGDRTSDLHTVCGAVPVPVPLRHAKFWAMDNGDNDTRVRVDKWLWAARFFKTRSAATEAIAGGKVHVNGERVKPAKLVQVGDELELRQGPYEFHLVVRGMAERRGSASVAAALYEETTASRDGRERVAMQLKAMYEGTAREIANEIDKGSRADVVVLTGG